jgi:hypothetical protein
MIEDGSIGLRMLDGDEDPFGFGDPALGVVYVQDTQCVERAAGFIFNYFNPN